MVVAYMNSLSSSKIKQKVEDLYDIADLPAYYRPKVGDSPYDDDWTLVCSERKYQLIMRQRGRDRVFTASKDLDECLYEMFKHLCGVVALEFAEANPSETELRWEIRCRLLQETLTKLNPDWGIRFKRSTEVFLSNHPLDEDRREKNERDRNPGNVSPVKNVVDTGTSTTLRDIYTPIDDKSELCLIKAQELLASDSLLKGLGQFSHTCPIPVSANVIRNFARADYLMNSKLMRDDPENQKNGDQYFQQILDGAVSQYEQNKYSSREAEKRLQPTYGKNEELKAYLKQIINKAYERNDVRQLLSAMYTDPDLKGVERHLDTNYPDIIFTCISSYIRAGYLGGTESWSVCQHLFHSLESGGIPTGWIGPLPENGGVAEDCLQIIHFGRNINQK